MAVFNEPTQWDHELGNNADVSTLPDDTGATTGKASRQKLFQLINQTPLEAGGVAPDREDFNALFKLLGDQIFYTQNGGVPSYNADYDYIAGRVVLYNGNLYKCIQANGASSTVVAPDSDDTYWKQLDADNNNTALITGQTIVSEIPLTDAKLHLKDGALLSGSGVYADFVDFIKDLYDSGTASSSFCTEAEWQTSNTNYGFCNKFVWDSVNDTVRLPKTNSEHGALIQSYSSGSNWYRIYQDGFCEQGGIDETWANDNDNTVRTSTINLHIPYIDTNYSIFLGTTQPTAIGNGSNNILYNSLTVSAFNIQHVDLGYVRTYWLTSGYIDLSNLQAIPLYEYIVLGTITKTEIEIDIDQYLADLANKADKDLSNVSAPAQAFKDMSLGWVVPDYSAGVAITFPYTCPSKGVIALSMSKFKDATLQVYINGVAVAGQYNQTTGYQTSIGGEFLVDENDVVTIDADWVYQTVTTFFPCKGV